MHSFQSEIFHLKSLKLHYIEIEEEILQKTVSEDEKNLYKQRFIIKINDSESWQAGVVALGNGKGYITVKTAFLKKHRLQLGDIVDVHLEKDESEFGMEFSAELKEVLFQDPEGERRFNLLPKGKQRYIIYYVNQVKSSQKRVERSLLLIGNLKRTQVGKEEFRFLLGKE
jgi:hypothetical protein